MAFYRCSSGNGGDIVEKTDTYSGTPYTVTSSNYVTIFTASRSCYVSYVGVTRGSASNAPTVSIAVNGTAVASGYISSSGTYTKIAVGQMLQKGDYITMVKSGGSEFTATTVNVLYVCNG